MKADFDDESKMVAQKIYEIEHSELFDQCRGVFPVDVMLIGGVHLELDHSGRAWLLYKGKYDMFSMERKYCKCVPCYDLTQEEIESILKAQPWK